MDTTLTRLKSYIEKNGSTIAEFERLAEWANGSLGAQIKKNGTVGINKLENVLKIYPKLNLEWLITGNGPMDKHTDNLIINEPEGLYQKSFDRRHDTQLIPLYDTMAAAGAVALFGSENENIIDYISIPNMPKCDGAMAVMGDSMYPLVKAGDLVLYKVIEDIPDSILWGQMYLVSVKIDGEYLKMVKFIHPSDRGDDWIRLVSQNTYHSPKDVKIKNIGAMALIKGMFRYTLS